MGFALGRGLPSLCALGVAAESVTFRPAAVALLGRCGGLPAGCAALVVMALHRLRRSDWLLQPGVRLSRGQALGVESVLLVGSSAGCAVLR